MARTGGSNWRVFASLEGGQYKKELKEIGVETRQFATKSQSDWKRVGNQLSGLTGRFSGLTRGMTGMFSGMSAGATAASAAILGIAGAVAVVTGAVSTSRRAWESYADIDIARRRTGAAGIGLGGSADYRRGMATDIGERVSREWGIDEGQIQVALRDIMGLNPESWQEAEELLLLGVKEWYYSGADMTQTAATFRGQATLWGKTAMEAADEMTKIVQLSGSGTVLQTAAQAASYYMSPAQQGGFESDLAGAVFAALTQLGVKPEQAGTRTAAVFRELADPTKGLGKVITEQAGGRDISELDSLELAAIMAAAYDALGATGLTASAETRTGLQAFADEEMLLSFVEAMRDSAGLFERVTSEVTESSKIETNKFSQIWRDFWKKWGEAISPEFTSRMKDFSASIQSWMNSQQFKDLASNIGKVSAEIIKLGAGALPVLLKGITNILEKITQNSKLFRFFAEAIETAGDLVEAALAISPVGVGVQGYRMTKDLLEGDVMGALRNLPAIHAHEALRDAFQFRLDMPELDTESQAGREREQFLMALNSINKNTEETAQQAGRGADAGESTTDLLEGEKDRAFFFAPFSTADYQRVGA